jgi:hypothetical protein
MKRLLFNRLSCALLGTIAAWPVILNHNIATNAKETLNGPERQVASYHKAMETGNSDKALSHFCTAERVIAKTSIDMFDPKGRNRERRNIYVAMAKGLYRLDFTRLFTRMQRAKVGLLSPLRGQYCSIRHRRNIL